MYAAKYTALSPVELILTTSLSTWNALDAGVAHRAPQRVGLHLPRAPQRVHHPPRARRERGAAALPGRQEGALPAALQERDQHVSRTAGAGRGARAASELGRRFFF